MNKNLIVSLALLTLIITACGGQATPAAHLPEAAAPTQAVTQPTLVPTLANIATDVPAPVSATQAPAAGVSFVKDVMPIFENSCNSCHGNEKTKAGLDLRTYESVMAGSFNGAVVVTGNSADSYLVQLVSDGEMPKRGDPLTAEQIKTISDWINGGAANN